MTPLVEAIVERLRYICSMDSFVRFGADILSLGQYIPIHEDRASAMAAVAQGSS